MTLQRLHNQSDHVIHAGAKGLLAVGREFLEHNQVLEYRRGQLCFILGLTNIVQASLDTLIGDHEQRAQSSLCRAN